MLHMEVCPLGRLNLLRTGATKGWKLATNKLLSTKQILLGGGGSQVPPSSVQYPVLSGKVFVDLCFIWKQTAGFMITSTYHHCQ